MSNTTKPILSWGWTAAAGLAFVAAFGIGRLIPNKSAPAGESSAAKGSQQAELTEEVRYKVPVSMAQPARGEAEAWVTIVEWCDFSTAGCKSMDATVEALRKEYGSKLRHVWRHFPQQGSAESTLAHELARIAHEQGGKFWQARALLLQHEGPLTRDAVTGYAQRLGLDPQTVNTALDKRTYAGAVVADGMFAMKFGVTEVPALFINGTRMVGPPTPARIKQRVERELAHAATFASSGVANAQLYNEITQDGLWEIPGSPLAKAR